MHSNLSMFCHFSVPFLSLAIIPDKVFFSLKILILTSNKTDNGKTDVLVSNTDERRKIKTKKKNVFSMRGLMRGEKMEK